MAYSKNRWNKQDAAVGHDKRVTYKMERIEDGIASAHDTLQYATNVNGELRWGNTTADYLAIEPDGSVELNGKATYFRDEIGDLLKTGLVNPAAHIVQDATEGSLDFTTACNLNDWAFMNVQVNHDWSPGSDVEPHVHFFQRSSVIPNWLLQYRWQRNGNEMSTAWVSLKWSTYALPYSGSTVLCQVVSFGTISAPSSYSVSDCLQLRLKRDMANGSSLFSGADGYSGDAEAWSYDVHIECNTIGSRSMYAK